MRGKDTVQTKKFYRSYTPVGNFSLKINKDWQFEIPFNIRTSMKLKVDDRINVFIKKDNEEDFEEFIKALEHEGCLMAIPGL
jgi:bifunctional DNA-binding transcriptional regulator/antitoxin component of YhaV-PrlF toxin-antitoxin module